MAVKSTTDDIGDYLTREQKLEALTEAVSIKGYQRLAKQSRQIQHYDWVDQRSDTFAEFYPMGSQGNKGRQGE